MTNTTNLTTLRAEFKAAKVVSDNARNLYNELTADSFVNNDVEAGGIAYDFIVAEWALIDAENALLAAIRA